MRYNTKPREVLLAFLEKNLDQNFTVSQIAHQLKDQNISLSAIYRNLSLLESEGKVRKSTNNGQKALFYQYLDSPCCADYIHVTCQKCSKIFHLNPELTKYLTNHLMKEEQFIITKIDSMLSGICKNCSKEKYND